MSGEHFSAGKMPHAPERFLSDELMSGVERNVVYGCTDVLLRNQYTGEVFLGDRQTEPQIGPWFIGGRNMYGEGIHANATRHVEHDFGLHLDPSRFKHFATYSTPFPVASPGREDHGRHTLNAVMFINLTSDEVGQINKNVESGKIAAENQSGRWHSPKEISRKDSDFPYAVKQAMRDLHGYDVMTNALHEEAQRENEIRTEIERERQDTELRKSVVVGFLTRHAGLTDEEANQLYSTSGELVFNGAEWVCRATCGLQQDDFDITKYKYSPEQTNITDFFTVCKDLLEDETIGDHYIKKILAEKHILPPRIIGADNGPTLRATLRAAVLLLDLDKEHKGEIIFRLKEMPREVWSEFLNVFNKIKVS